MKTLNKDYLVGEIKMDEKVNSEIHESVQLELIRFMNKYKIFKLDVCLNPWSKKKEYTI